MEEPKNIIERHTTPTRFDIAPTGSLCRVMNEPNTYYIQVSDSDDQTQWEPISTVLSEILAGMFDDEKFIEEVMKLYFDKERPLKTLCDIINRDRL